MRPELGGGGGQSLPDYGSWEGPALINSRHNQTPAFNTQKSCHMAKSTPAFELQKLLNNSKRPSFLNLPATEHRSSFSHNYFAPNPAANYCTIRKQIQNINYTILHAVSVDRTRDLQIFSLTLSQLSYPRRPKDI